jgi:hypothetical protein
MTLSTIMKEELDFRYMQIWLSVYLLSMFVKGKVNFRYVQIWLWVCLSREKLTLDMSKYDFKYVCQRESWI